MWTESTIKHNETIWPIQKLPEYFFLKWTDKNACKN